MSEIVKTKRLTLRKLTPSDEELLNRELNIPAVTKLLGGVLKEKEQRALFLWLVKHQQETYGHTFWPIELHSTQEFVGLCGLVTVDEQDSTVLGATELGYRIKPSAQRNGYSTEAAAACLQIAFDKEEVWWVVSRTTIENVGSWAVMKAVGMRHDPRLDYCSKDGTAFIVHVMTLQEWKKRGREICRAILVKG